jgi:hypothetical protein
VGRLIALVAVVAASGLFGYYRRWLETQRRRASETSVVVTTAMGPVEYDLRGQGPTVLHFHGGNVRPQRLVLPRAPRHGRLSPIDAGPAGLSRHPYPGQKLGSAHLGRT